MNAILQTNGLSNLSLQEMTKLLLYGHERLPADANKKIFDIRIHPCFRTLSIDESKTKNPSYYSFFSHATWYIAPCTCNFDFKYLYLL